MTAMPTPRPLPASLEAEKAVLGALLLDPSALDDVADLVTDDFLLPAHREILEAIRAVAKSGRPIDVLLVTDELKARDMLARIEGGAAYLNDMANDTPVVGNLRHYVRLVREKAILRKLIRTCASIQAAAYGDVNVDDLLAEARYDLAALDTGEDKGPSLIGDELGATMDSIENRAEKPAEYFVQTGIRTFDEKVTGLRGGNLIVIAARPGRAKSALALNILLNAATNGIPVLLFSFEMTMQETIERAISNRSQVDGRRVVSGRMDGPEWVRVHHAASKLSRLPFWLYDRNATAPRICSLARQWLAKQRRKQPDGVDQRLALVAVDYIGLVKSTGDAETREREVAGISAGFKQLAGELKIPVVAISQINRESEKTGREPRISDLRESGSIEQDANMILFPHWDEAAAATRLPRGGIEAKILIGKNRGGPEGFVWVEWLPEFMTFRDLDGDAGPQQEALL